MYLHWRPEFTPMPEILVGMLLGLTPGGLVGIWVCWMTDKYKLSKETHMGLFLAGTLVGIVATLAAQWALRKYGK